MKLNYKGPTYSKSTAQLMIGSISDQTVRKQQKSLPPHPPGADYEFLMFCIKQWLVDTGHLNKPLMTPTVLTKEWLQDYLLSSDRLFCLQKLPTDYFVHLLLKLTLRRKKVSRSRHRSYIKIVFLVLSCCCKLKQLKRLISDTHTSSCSLISQV